MRKTLFGIPYQFYWFSYGWIVHIRLISEKKKPERYKWDKIYGLQFGSWFIGCIKGEKSK